ncbi:MAG TPA: CRISPR-associated endoribonuclease Cas6 [Ignavibacteria bacterium]|nr:CRISPR-associated endoribonuclease Cas6 [Ignavibacteria bacterium]HMR40304.1 CRISPR-associated endoribonuclease Cas6 [Ignavibacteria bacterium]
MRLKLILKQSRPNQLIPINYQYAISSFIYNTIETSDSEYSKWLHEKGYQSGSKKFKLFTFSMLNIPKRNVEFNKLRILSDTMELTVSMISHKAIEHFIIGMFENKIMRIYDFESEAEFQIKTVELIPEPEFNGKSTFKTISPVVLSKRTIYQGKESSYYMSPEDEDYGSYFLNNISEKYKTFTGEANSNIKLKEFKLLGECRRKLIRIKENKSEVTDVRGYIFRFSLEGDRELIRFGYESGFGKQCSMGFGCVQVV